MTRQTINLLGILVIGAILVLGLLLVALPRWNAAHDADAQRSTVELQNQSQQALISAYAQQRQQLPQLQSEVVALKQQIAPGPHLEQVIELASDLPSGAVLRSITPTVSDPTAAASPAASAPAGGSASGFTALPVTVVIGLRQPADAAKVLDKLRSGPRLLAVDRATLAPGSSGAGLDARASYTLTVGGRVFLHEETPTAGASAGATAGATP